MKCKKSIFNTTVDELEDGRKLIYNTYSGVYGIMDKKTQAVYEGIEDFISEGVLDKEILKSVDIMQKAGYIVDVMKDELATLKTERAIIRYRSSTLGLTIAPTMDCNMCCPYCYEENRNIVMNEEIQEALVCFLKDKLNADSNLTNVNIVWFGGEPLMQKEIIYSLSQKIIDLCKESDIRYSAGIITNGILMDKETARRLVEDCKVTRAQITIDGMKELHNKRRILISGEDSFEIITKNIEACKDIIPIYIRVNVDRENASEIETLTKYFLEEKGWADRPSFYLSPVELNNSTCDIANAACLQGEEFGEMDIACVKANYAANRELVANTFFPRRRPMFCGGEGTFSYVIDPDGDFYNCYRQMGKKECSTGHISKSFLITTEYGKWLHADVPEKCEKCEYLPMCMGGCGLWRIPNGGEAKCFHTAFTYKEILKLAYQDYLLQKSKPETAAGH